jgi:hypothetical protein
MIQHLSHSIQQKPNARIKPTEASEQYARYQKPDNLVIKGSLARVGLNELLDFVRRDHSASPDLSRLFLAFNMPIAAWRFNLLVRQLSMAARGSEHSTSISPQE